MRHPNQAPARESVERPLTEPTQASNRPPAPGNDDLASPLDSLQILAEAIMELTDSNFALGLM